MKNLIVILFSMVLGVYIFTTTLSGSDSIKAAGAGVMEVQVEMLTTSP